jgi:hypothetical protein
VHFSWRPLRLLALAASCAYFFMPSTRGQLLPFVDQKPVVQSSSDSLSCPSGHAVQKLRIWSALLNTFVSAIAVSLIKRRSCSSGFVAGRLSSKLQVVVAIIGNPCSCLRGPLRYRGLYGLGLGHYRLRLSSSCAQAFTRAPVSRRSN